MASHLFVIAVSMVLSAACRSDSHAVLESEPAVAAGRRATVSMIYSPAHGDTAFTAPMFDDFLRRSQAD